MSKKVALLHGGWSAERDVSLEKTPAVKTALEETGYHVTLVDVGKDLQKLIDALTPRPDFVFNNLYGRGGEDGVIQGVLEMLGLPYTHSGVTASAIAMDKPLTKKLAASEGVKSAPYVVLKPGQVKTCLENKAFPVEFPLVLKPACEGSSVGVAILKSAEDCARIASDYKGDVLVERYIPGQELTVAVLDGKAQAVTEIISESGFFDYEAKYKAPTTRYVLPAEIEGAVYNQALKAAESVYKVLGCAGLARCDFRYDVSEGAEGLYFLEINTQPGLTPQSIAPAQVIYNGMNFSKLCAHLVETAKCHG